MKNFVLKYRGILAGIVFFSLGMVFYIIMQVFDLWTFPGGHATPFCENFDPSKLVGEPINTWSNMFYVGAGMIVLVIHDFIRNGKITRYTSYISKEQNLHYALTYGLLVVWLGLGSFFMHGSYARNEIVSGHFFDALSMNMYVSSVVMISLAILLDMKKKHFYSILSVNFIVIIPLVKFNLQEYYFILFLIIAVANEFAICLGMYFGMYSKLFARKNKRIRRVKRNLLLFIFASAMFISSYMLWFLGKTAAATCDPYSWWQWHAYWHFGTAAAALILAFYILLEKEIIS